MSHVFVSELHSSAASVIAHDGMTDTVAIVKFEFDLFLLQAQRALHACMETDHYVSVPKGEKRNMAYLANRFSDIRYVVDHPDARQVRAMIDHPSPSVRIGSLEWPLLMPHGVVRRARSMWSERLTVFTFTGLVTPDRDAFLKAIATDLGVQLKRTRSRRTPWARRPSGSVAEDSAQIVLEDSSRGRAFPEKLWDDRYYSSMACSQYVVCPEGDFAWSYRFFEACLCGAVPIVQTPVQAYEGFTFVDASGSDIRLPRWSVDLAERNFSRAVEVLTADRDALGRAILEALA